MVRQVPLDTPRVEVFLYELEKALKANHLAAPHLYTWKLEHLPEIMAKYKVALERNSFSVNTLSMRQVCKTLSIPNTLRAVNEWLTLREIP